MAWHQERLSQTLKELAAQFVSVHANRTVLITVIDVHVQERGTHATIRVSVFPDDAIPQALGFLKRQRTVFREFIKEKMPGLKPPHIDFELKKEDNLHEPS
jgi:ribosome-binding factor A